MEHLRGTWCIFIQFDMGASPGIKLGQWNGYWKGPKGEVSEEQDRHVML